MNTDGFVQGFRADEFTGLALRVWITGGKPTPHHSAVAGSGCRARPPSQQALLQMEPGGGYATQIGCGAWKQKGRAVSAPAGSSREIVFRIGKEEERNLMSKSGRTDPPAVVASRRMDTNEDGEPKLPRIIERRPFSGDVHPVPKQVLESLLLKVPPQYWYGLTAIEFRARNGPIGEPFALYHPNDQRIWLYSLPLEWRLTHVAEWVRDSLDEYGAEVSEADEGFQVSWPDPAWPMMSLWFFHRVFLHELGHHFNYQYKARRTPIKGLAYEEANATLHGFRIERSLFEAWLAGREKPDAE